MKKIIIIIASAVLVIGAVGAGFVLSKMNSPEYALAETIGDVKASGIDGLKKHLTEEACEKIDKIVEWTSGSSLISDILSSGASKEGVSLLVSQIAEVEWTVEDVLKGKKQAAVVIGFNYYEKIAGTIDITMVRADSKWKIDGIGIPDFKSLE